MFAEAFRFQARVIYRGRAGLHRSKLPSFDIGLLCSQVGQCGKGTRTWVGALEKSGRNHARARKPVAAVQGGSAVASAARQPRDLAPASLSLVGQSLRHAVLVQPLDRIGDFKNSGGRPRTGATR
jgi:hypothetical protein